MLINKKNNKAFSLIEVLIFVSILSIFFVAVATVTVASLRNMKINEHKILATYYAEQLLEWVRDQKEADWMAFLSKSAEGSGKKYCFNSTTLSWPSEGQCTTYGLLSFFKRDLKLVTTSSGSQINATVTISWQEVGNNYQVPLATVFTVWED
jgi:type II secretory pathway pseudopilin PulG